MTLQMDSVTTAQDVPSREIETTMIDTQIDLKNLANPSPKPPKIELTKRMRKKSGGLFTDRRPRISAKDIIRNIGRGFWRRQRSKGGITITTTKRNVLNTKKNTLKPKEKKTLFLDSCLCAAAG